MYVYFIYKINTHTLCSHQISLNCLVSVHRIGRTGRSGKTGIATTFINKGCGKEKYQSSQISNEVLCRSSDFQNICTYVFSCIWLKAGVKWQYVHRKCMSFPIDESVLMDLKALLVEAKQKVPPVLQVLQTGDETMLDIGGEPFTPNLVHISFSRLLLHLWVSL